MIIHIDGKEKTSKKEVLSIFKDSFEEMYALNYDALLDVLTAYYEDKLIIELAHTDSLEDKKNLYEVLEIAEKENPNIIIIRSA